MKQLEIPFELKKEENKCIFGGYNGYKGENWITLDDSKTIKERKKHVFVFNHERCEMFCGGCQTDFLIDDSIDLKPSPKAYLTLASFLKKKGYKFNKKLATFEEKPYLGRGIPKHLMGNP
jgi:hypothetical protein